MRIQTNVPIEISLGKEYSSQELQIEGNGKTLTLPIFQKADGKYYVRFSSPVEGAYTYNADNKKHTIEVIKYKGTNPLFRLGAIQLSKNKQYLIHHDGTPFFYLADTWWFGATVRLPFPKRFQTLLKDRKEKGFTAVQVVVGIPPEIEPFDDNAKNEGGLPFNKDWSLNASYFDAMDKRIDSLVNSGIVPVLFGGWGHHIDWMGVEHVKKLWHEIIARYSSYPVIFSLCGEADVFLVPKGIDPKTADTAKTEVKKILEKLPRPVFNTAVILKRFGSRLVYQKQEKKLLEERIKKWSEVGSIIRIIEPFGRVITVHLHRSVTAFGLFGNPSWLTLNAIQSGHTLASVGFMLSSIQKGEKPIINLEPWYEGIAENFGAYHQRIAFWYSVLSGAKGHGYGAHGIWQMAQGDNFMRHWGKSDVKDAIGYEGATQLGKAKQFLTEKIDWITLQPDTSLISYRADDQNVLPPVASKSEKEVMVYIPNQQGLKTLILKKELAKHPITVIDPSTITKPQSLILANNTVKLPILKTRDDVLLVIEGKTT